MKKIFLLLLLSPMLFLSCSEESCDDTTRNTINFDLFFSVNVKYQDGRDALNAPIKVSLQKYWCDGDYSIITSHSGITGDNGDWLFRTSYDFELSNEFDYVYMIVEIGANPVILTDEYKFYYSDISIENGSFNFLKVYTLNL